MPESLPIFDEMDAVFGIVVFIEVDGKKKINFKQREGTVIDLSDMMKFKSFLERSQIPEDQFLKAMRFYNETMLYNLEE